MTQWIIKKHKSKEYVQVWVKRVPLQKYFANATADFMVTFEDGSSRFIDDHNVNYMKELIKQKVIKEAKEIRGTKKVTIKWDDIRMEFK